jgi:hypothetical protein
VAIGAKNVAFSDLLHEPLPSPILSYPRYIYLFLGWISVMKLYSCWMILSTNLTFQGFLVFPESRPLFEVVSVRLVDVVLLVLLVMSGAVIAVIPILLIPLLLGSQDRQYNSPLPRSCATPAPQMHRGEGWPTPLL